MGNGEPGEEVKSFLTPLPPEVLNLDMKPYISGYKSHTSVSGSKS